jgi:peptidoglycan hydrolase-like protein with peptidoglycan-binding domain
MRKHASITKHRGFPGGLKPVVGRALVAAGLTASLLALPAIGGSPVTALQPPVAVAAAEAAQSDCLPTLSQGARGKNVLFVQVKLNQNMLGTPPIAADGIFGERTFGRVRLYQRSVGLDVDGVVGPRTWKKLGGCFEPG